MTPPPGNFTAEFLEQRLAEHQRWQRSEVEQLVMEAIEEIEAAKALTADAPEPTGERGSNPRCRSRIYAGG